MENIRFVLIIAFAMISLMLWQAWQVDYGPKLPIAQIENPAVADVKEDLPTTANAPGQAQSSVQQVANTPLAAASIAAPVVTVKTDVLSLEIDMQGGTIQNLDLLQYPVEKDNTVVNAIRKMVGLPDAEKNRQPVRLFNSSPEKMFIAQSGLIAGSGFAAAPDHHTVYANQASSYVLADGQDSLTVPLTWTDNNGLIITKAFIFKRGSYEITLNQNVKNNSGKDWSGRQYSQLLRVPFSENSGNMLTAGMRAYDGGVVYTDKEKYKKIAFDDMVDDNLDVATQGGWAAMIQHYFASAWIPPAESENHFYTKHLKDERYVIGSYSPPVTVANNTEAQFVSRLFSGPKIQPVMEKVAPGLELTVDYSVLTFIGKPIYWLLNKIHSFTNNWGFAIIGVTFCIKLLMFPLTQASFISMARMRKIQPRLKELQERFADDRPRFNKEMMDMYKKEKVNPLGGCLPILFQIPVFMSLYWVLSETVEFRQAPFLLWIQDMSVMDPFLVLPVIMGITMKIQQGLNPPPIDPVQAKILKMFPLVFTVFFLFFPAGLVLYWVVNNTLSIIQQTYITKKINAQA
ncbi:membrane protein insertase YidC [Methyloglobulus sp.]|uniref:membrane protein insertase YidC n=1 Tax=Methyloglobulus sp. TaxID=2518622 RepID=UPI0032B82E5D